MIETWLDLPASGVFAVLTVLYAAAAAAIVWVTFGRRLGPWRCSAWTGWWRPFFSAVGILFALMAGFLACDIADRNRQAVRVVQAETAELRNVFTLSVASKPDMRRHPRRLDSLREGGHRRGMAGDAARRQRFAGGGGL